MTKKNKNSTTVTMTKQGLVDLILERVEAILLEQGLAAQPGLGDGFGNEQTPFDGMDNPGGEDPLMATGGMDDGLGMDSGEEENPAAEADSLLTMDDLESMEQPDARKTLMAGMQGSGEERKTTADLVAAILGDPSKAQQDGIEVDPEALPASPELQQTASDVAAISGLTLEEMKTLKEMFRSYLSEKNSAKKQRS